MSEEKVEVVPLSKMKEVVSYCFAYLVLTFSFNYNISLAGVLFSRQKFIAI